MSLKVNTSYELNIVHADGGQLIIPGKNIILNTAYQCLAARDPFASKIAIGSGSDPVVQPVPQDTILQNEWYRATATRIENSDNEWVRNRYSYQIPQSYAGNIVAECGLVSFANVLTTRALFASPYTILDGDIVTVTVQVAVQTTVIDSPAFGVTQTVMPTMSNVYQALTGATALSSTQTCYAFRWGVPVANIIGTPFVITSTACNVNVAGIGTLTIDIQGTLPTSTGNNENIAGMSIGDNDLYSLIEHGNYQIADVQIGTGDGTTTVFPVPVEYVQSAMFYVDGTLTPGTFTNHKVMFPDDLGRYFVLLDISDATKEVSITSLVPQPAIDTMVKAVFIQIDSDIAINNMAIAANVMVECSDDMQTWQTVSVLNNIPSATGKFWRITVGQIAAGTQAVSFANTGIQPPSVEFATAPAAGSVITMGGVVEELYKTPDTSLSVDFAITA